MRMPSDVDDVLLSMVSILSLSLLLKSDVSDVVASVSEHDDDDIDDCSSSDDDDCLSR